MSKNIYYVYCHISPNNKYYIGITGQNPEYRWRKEGKGYQHQKLFWRAIQKYGWDNFEHKILYSKLTKEEACKQEQNLITYYKSNNSKYGYNCSVGGESGTLGAYNNALSKPVFQYDLNGNFIKKWGSMMEVQRELNIPNSAMSKCCKGKFKTMGGFQWDYNYVENKGKVLSKGKRSNINQCKTVYQYNLDGIFINSYKSLSEMSKETGFDFKSVSDCCLGKIEQTYNYIWSYEHQDKLNPVVSRYERVAKKLGRKINQYTLDNVFMTQYNSIAEACRSINKKCNSQIINCCKGLSESSCGYKWKYA